MRAGVGRDLVNRDASHTQAPWPDPLGINLLFFPAAVSNPQRQRRLTHWRGGRAESNPSCMIVYEWARRHLSLRGGTTATRPSSKGRRVSVCPALRSRGSPTFKALATLPRQKDRGLTTRPSMWAFLPHRDLPAVWVDLRVGQSVEQGACETPGEPRAGDLGVGGLQIMGEVRDSIALKPHGGRGGVWRRPPGPGLGSWFCGFFFVGVL